MMENEQPLVSVVIPVFNAERYLRCALDSVMAQDYPNIEVITVDDGSTDNSPSVLRDYSGSIKIVNQSNAGSARARNEGLRRVNGQYISFLDADDLWHPAKVRIQVDHLEANPDIGLVYNDWFLMEGAEPAMEQFANTRFSQSGDYIDSKESGWLYHKLLLDCLVHTSAVMMRRTILDKVGLLDESLRIGEDYDYWIRVSRETKIHKIDLKLSAYRQHHASVTHIPAPINYGAMVVENALQRWGRRGPDGQEASILSVRNRLAWSWYGYGYLHLERGSRRIARDAFRTACVLAPWRVGYWKKLAESILKRPK